MLAKGRRRSAASQFHSGPRNRAVNKIVWRVLTFSSRCPPKAMISANQDHKRRETELGGIMQVEQNFASRRKSIRAAILGAAMALAGCASNQVTSETTASVT